MTTHVKKKEREKDKKNKRKTDKEIQLNPAVTHFKGLVKIIL